jgi:hypothetical protein
MPNRSTHATESGDESPHSKRFAVTQASTLTTARDHYVWKVCAAMVAGLLHFVHLCSSLNCQPDVILAQKGRLIQPPVPPKMGKS